MDFVAHALQLRVNEGGYGKLIANHHSGYSCGQHIVTNRHCKDSMRREGERHRKIEAARGANRHDGTYGVRHKIQG